MISDGKSFDELVDIGIMQVTDDLMDVLNIPMVSKNESLKQINTMLQSFNNIGNMPHFVDIEFLNEDHSKVLMKVNANCIPKALCRMGYTDDYIRNAPRQKLVYAALWNYLAEWVETTIEIINDCIENNGSHKDAALLLGKEVEKVLL